MFCLFDRDKNSQWRKGNGHFGAKKKTNKHYKLEIEMANQSA